MKQLIIDVRPFAKYLLIGWLAAIIIISSIPSLPTPKISIDKYVLRLDYLFHLCEYGGLALLAFLSFTGERFYLTFYKFLIIALSLVVFAFLDEFHQKLIPGRTFNPKDLISNITGIMASLILCILFFRKIANHLRDLNYC